MGVLTNSAKLIEKIQSIKSVVTGSSAPSNPSTGDLWYDTTSTVKALKMYDGTNWLVMGPELVSLTQAQYDALPAAEKNNGKYYLITDGNGTVVAGGISTTQPSSPSTGDIYYDTTNNVVKVYNGTTWIEVGGGEEFTAANGGTKIFDMPTVNSDITDILTWLNNGGGVILKETISSNLYFYRISLRNKSIYPQALAAERVGYNNDSYIKVLTFTVIDGAPTVASVGVIESGISDTALSASWDGDTTHAPSKNAVYDAIGNIETLLAAI